MWTPEFYLWSLAAKFLITGGQRLLSFQSIDTAQYYDLSVFKHGTVETRLKHNQKSKALSDGRYKSGEHPIVLQVSSSSITCVSKFKLHHQPVKLQKPSSLHTKPWFPDCFALLILLALSCIPWNISQVESLLFTWFSIISFWPVSKSCKLERSTIARTSEKLTWIKQSIESFLDMMRSADELPLWCGKQCISPSRYHHRFLCPEWFQSLVTQGWPIAISQARPTFRQISSEWLE